MPTIDPNRFVIVASYLSPGVSKGAAGFAIVNGKIVKIPPRGLRQLEAVTAMLDAASGVTSKPLARQMQQLALELAEDALQAKAAA